MPRMRTETPKRRRLCLPGKPNRKLNGVKYVSFWIHDMFCTQHMERNSRVLGCWDANYISNHDCWRRFETRKPRDVMMRE